MPTTSSEGWSFKGWYTTAGYGGVSMDQGEKVQVDRTTKPDGDTTYYARWDYTGGTGHDGNDD